MDNGTQTGVDSTPVAAPDASAAPAVSAPATPAAAPALAAPPLGDTIVPDPEAANQLRQSREAYDKAQQLSEQSTTPTPGPHARLLKIVSSLLVGLGAAGDSIATGGEQGGVKEVSAIQGQQKQQEMEAQRLRDEQKTQRVQQQIQMGQLHEANFHNIVALQTMPDELMLHHLQAQGAQLGIIGQTQDIRAKALQALVSGDVEGAQQSLDQLQKTTKTSGGTSSEADIKSLMPTAIAQIKKPIVEAQNSAFKDDPNIQNEISIFNKAEALASSDPKQAMLLMAGASSRAANLIDALNKGTATVKANAEASSAALKTQQDKLAQSTYDRTVARNAAGQPIEDFATWQARSTKEAEVKAQQGDPSTLGAMAADGLITIPQVALARQLDKKGFQQMMAAADEEAKRNGSPEIVVNGRRTGHYFNANAATQQYDYVKAFNDPNSKSQQSINAGSTFLEHAADLTAVNSEYRRTNTAILNTPLNKIADKFGNATYTKFIAALAPVKTEYDNALKAGFAPTAEDAEAVDAILKTSATPAQIEAGVKAMAHTIVRRLDSTNQGYKTHAGVDYPNMITPNAATSLQQLGVDASSLQSGGGFAGTPQSVRAGATAPSGKSVSLKAAMALPINKGKSEAAVRADIQAHGHQVGE